MLSVETWDGHDINDGTTYRSGFTPGAEWGLPDVQVRSLRRVGAWPVATGVERPGRTVSLYIAIEDCANVRALRGQLLGWFNPEDETPKALVITDDDTSVSRYVMATCQQLRPIIIGAAAAPTLFRADLIVDGDVRWRAVTPATDSWGITASGQTRIIANDGDDDAYSIIEITPTVGKTGGYAYKRYSLVTWRAINAGTNYPIRLGPLDTAALVTASKMRADGYDLRVFVDGQETPRFLVDMNSANTYIWFSVDWKRAPTLEITASLAGAGTITSIELDDEVEMALLPSEGFVRINNEVFRYTARDLLNRRLTGITRAVWGTAAAAHSAGDDAYWMQHEIILVYGLATATNPAYSISYEPTFTLGSSTNTSWYFEIFGWLGVSRPAAWQFWGNLTAYGQGGVYSETERSIAPIYTVIGAWISVLHGEAYGWHLDNPCGIVNASWADGKKRAVVVTDFLVHLMYWVREESWWSWQATLTSPALPNTWEPWSEAAAGTDWDPATSLAIGLYYHPSDAEAGTVTVSLNADEVPVTGIGSETGNYTLSTTIANETTGESITVRFEMALAQTLEIDTDERTVLYQLDNSNQFQAVALDSARLHWLRLAPGNNTLRFTDTGTAGVTFETAWEERYY